MFSLMRAMLLLGMASYVATAAKIQSPSFAINVDDTTGALLSISDPSSDNEMSYISGPLNAPWQPPSSHWGLGFIDLGREWLLRAYWSTVTSHQTFQSSTKSVYNLGPIELTVFRNLQQDTFTETYSFKNTGNSDYNNLAKASNPSFGIYTPFNDHYTNTSDCLQSRTHAHVWAHGGATGWAKMNQMGGRGRDLGMVLTKGSLKGYSIESRNRLTSSNTRGVFVLHPAFPSLGPGESHNIEFTFFWHKGWDEFFDKCKSISKQFIQFETPHYSYTPGQRSSLTLSGASVNSDTMVQGQKGTCNNGKCEYVTFARDSGETSWDVSTNYDGQTYNSKFFTNNIPFFNELLSARTKFIAEKQQYMDANISSIHGAYVLYDNQMEKQVTFDLGNGDHNSGRERLGMGVLMALYLKNNTDNTLKQSLSDYYSFVCSQLQDDNGYVLDGPGNRGKRLYNWPWVMTLHLAVSELDIKLPPGKSPIERLMQTIESFYAEGGTQHYSIQLPLLATLRALHDKQDLSRYNRALELFTKHGQFILDQHLNYPASEVNFEQSIVGPAANILLELYRWTNDAKWLDGANEHFETLERFAGKQPDFHMYGVPIRHWDGYWFGKDKLWGDVFPHHWSAISALARHHMGVVRKDNTLTESADELIRSNMVLFTPDGRGSAAWIYPDTVDGRDAHYADPYANDQDWALVHYLQIEADKRYNGPSLKKNSTRIDNKYSGSSQRNSSRMEG